MLPSGANPAGGSVPDDAEGARDADGGDMTDGASTSTSSPSSTSDSDSETDASSTSTTTTGAEDFHDDDDEDDEDAEERRRFGPVQRALWRILTGAGEAGDLVAVGRDRDRDYVSSTPSTHDSLVASLIQSCVLSSPRVVAAMRLLRRGDFLPPQLRSHPDAYTDAPLPLEGLGFNVSAPHIHAACLEHLDVPDGASFLDVGSGCGIATCLAALLVGKEGSVLGVDVNPSAIHLAKTNEDDARANNPAYASQSCRVEFLRHNIFLPHSMDDEDGAEEVSAIVSKLCRHPLDPLGGVSEEGGGSGGGDGDEEASSNQFFDRILVGATCPREKIPQLLTMLNPNTGRMVVPCGLELQLYVAAKAKKSSDVDGDPVDGDPVDGRLPVTDALGAPSPSTAAETASATEFDMRVLSHVRFGHLNVPSDAKVAVETLKRNRKVFASVKKTGDASRSGLDQMDVDTGDSDSDDCDCVLQVDGDGESGIPARKHLLRRHCSLFRAQTTSGMSDADTDRFILPANFSRKTVANFVHFIEANSNGSDATVVDGMPIHLDEASGGIGPVIDLLLFARYVDCPALLTRCTSKLEASLDCTNACALLMLGDANALVRLKRLATDYIVDHFDAIDPHTLDVLDVDSMRTVAARAAALLKNTIHLLDKPNPEHIRINRNKFS